MAAGSGLEVGWPLERTLPSSVGVPHSWQNLAPARSGAPQFRQPSASEVPHSRQNFAPGWLSVPQLEQVKDSRGPSGGQVPESDAVADEDRDEGQQRKGEPEDDGQALAGWCELGVVQRGRLPAARAQAAAPCSNFDRRRLEAVGTRPVKTQTHVRGIVSDG